MMIHEITQLAGKHRKRKRVGRGPGSGNGKTAGRGHKGAKSRSGFSGSQHATFEGGQMPYFRRIPKRGFNNAQFRTEYAIVNVKDLQHRFDDGAQVTTETLVKVGLIRHADALVKILAEGELTKKLTITADRFSEAAREKIIKAGGACMTIERRGGAPIGAKPFEAPEPPKSKAEGQAKPDKADDAPAEEKDQD